MVETYFTKNEASHKLGQKVRSASTLPSVPAGTDGTVAKIIDCGTDDWRVRIQWQRPRPISLIDAAEVSFLKNSRPAFSDFSKSAYEKSIEEIS
jgi:hypothetical protein